LSELDLPGTMTTHFPDPEDILNFELNISPDEGYYLGGHFNFTFKINSNYPHEPPKIRCTQTIYHPNIDLEGNVCLNILREDWKPVLNLNTIMVGLQYLFLEPNPDDPLNKVAAQVLKTDIRVFKNNVRASMQGGVFDGIKYTIVKK